MNVEIPSPTCYFNQLKIKWIEVCVSNKQKNHLATSSEEFQDREVVIPIMATMIDHTHA